jgi:sarcosine oxidase subunit alpha
MALPGWTLPGVITAGAAQTLINANGVLPGRRVVMIGVDPLALSVAQLMAVVGAQVQGIFLPPANGLQLGSSTPQTAIETVAKASNYAPSPVLSIMGLLAMTFSEMAARLFPIRGIKTADLPLMLRRAVLSIQGEDHVEGVQIATLRADGSVEPGKEEHWEVDAVITSAGLSPLVELAQVAGCPLVHVADLGGWVPLHSDRQETPVPGLFVAGSITGVEGAPVAEAQGRIAGVAAAGYLGLIETTEMERDLSIHRSTVEKARRKALPFLPDIKAGRRQMARIWEENHTLLRPFNLMQSPPP